MEPKFDTIGYWSEVKLDIVREYASAYSRILSAQSHPKLHHAYVDAFAGYGLNVSRRTGEFVLGSPMNALLIEPPFKEFYFIDIDAKRVETLESECQARDNVHVYEGDCNQLLLDKVFPNVSWNQYRRGLCVLDPYGLDLDWRVIETAGRMRSIEIFLNFPVMDMNRNVLWLDPSGVSDEQRERLTRYWGDQSWRERIYDGSGDLFGHETKVDNWQVALAFRDRLKNIAQFSHVPEPIPMRNSRNAVVYYLFFASHKPVAERIVEDIFAKYRTRGVT